MKIPQASSPLLAKQIQRGSTERIAEILETLVALGKARALEPGRFLGRTV